MKGLNIKCALLSDVLEYMLRFSHCRWEWGSLMGLRRKYLHGPHMEDRGAARFIQVEIVGCLCVPPLSVSWRKSICVLSKTKT